MICNFVICWWNNIQDLRYVCIVQCSNLIEPPRCKSLHAIREEIPEEIWTASGLDGNDTLEIGKTFQFRCPKGLSLSFDNDKFDPYDDRWLNLFFFCIYHAHYHIILKIAKLSYLTTYFKISDIPCCAQADHHTWHQRRKMTGPNA